MLIHPDFDPIAIHLGPLAIHWYGIMYLIGFFACWGMLILRLRESPRALKIEQLSDLLFYALLGLVIGGRLGYMLFYNFQGTIHHPLQIFAVWEGGMSFHGGLIGGLLALWLYARKIHVKLIDITDIVAPVVPLGLAAGRIGNFINGELWGRVTDMPWGMLFPAADDLPRHPSQLYEFMLEGVVMFLILWFYSSKPKPRGAVSGLFFLLYGSFRIFVEFFREPDQQIGYLAFGWLTEGQLLSLPILMLGIILLLYAYRGKKHETILALFKSHSPSRHSKD